MESYARGLIANRCRGGTDLTPTMYHGARSLVFQTYMIGELAFSVSVLPGAL